MKFDLLDHSLSDRFALHDGGALRWESLAGLFSGGGTGAAASSAASSAAAEGAIAEGGGMAAQAIGSSSAVTASEAAAAGPTAAQLLQYGYQGATLLQGLSGYQSGVANAAYLKAGAKQARMVGAANKNLMDARGRAALGELKAQAGASGTTFSGSPMLVYLDSVRNAAIESATEYYQGATRATNLKEQAKFTRKGAQNDLWSGIIGAAGPSIANLGSRLLS